MKSGQYFFCVYICVHIYSLGTTIQFTVSFTLTHLVLNNLGIKVLVLFQFEQLFGIFPPNLGPIGNAQLGAVEPIASRLEFLERVVDREQDAVRTDLVHAEVERGRGEVPARRDPDVLVEVLADRLLAAQPQRLLDVLEPVVDAPQVEGDVLAQVAQDDLQRRVAVEDAVGHHAEHVQADALGKGQRRADEPLPVLPQLLEDGARRVARVQVEGHVQLRAGPPEDVPLGLVVEDHVVPVGPGALRVVDQGALEAVLRHAAAELGGGLLGVVHGQGPREGAFSETGLAYVDFHDIQTYANAPRRSSKPLMLPAT